MILSGLFCNTLFKILRRSMGRLFGVGLFLMQSGGLKWCGKGQKKVTNGAVAPE